jgi:hypothetical protein
VDIGSNGTRIDGDRRGPAQSHILPDGGDQLDQFLVHGPPGAGIGRPLDPVEIAVLVEGDPGDRRDKALEYLVTGNEIGLRIDFDHGPARALHMDADQPLGGHSTGFLRGRRQTLLAQPVDRRFDIAGGLRQRLLTIHHAGAGLLPQLLDQAGRDIRHNLTFHFKCVFY